MDIDQRLIPALQKVQFASRYFKLCKRYSDFDNSLDDYDKSIIKAFFEKKGIKVSFVRSERFYKIIDKVNNLSVQLNIVPKRGFLQFVLDIKKGKERLNLGCGMWESITRELENIKSKKPLFGSNEELKDILEEMFSIYSDFKIELSKIQT